MSVIDKHSATLTFGATTVEILSGSLTMDDTRAPMYEARLQVLTPTSSATLDARTFKRGTLRLEQRFSEVAFTYDLTTLHAGKTTAQLTTQYGGLTTAHVTASLGFYASAGGTSNGRTLSLVLRETRRVEAGITEILLQSDECLLVDDLLFTFNPEVITSTTIAGWIEAFNNLNEVRGYVFESTVDISESNPSAPTGLYPPDPSARSLFIEPGQSLWEVLQGPLQQVECRIYSPGDGRLLVVADSWTSRAVTLTIAQGVNLIDYGDEFARDSEVWGDAVIVKYDSAGASSGYIASVSTTQSSFTRPLLVEVTGVSPVGGFDPDPPRIANRALTRASRRGRDLDVVAVNDYRLEPRGPLILDLPVGDFTGTVQSATLQIGGDWQATITAQEVIAA